MWGTEHQRVRGLLWGLFALAFLATAAQIKSGATSDFLTIDSTSKAARVTAYDTRGNVMGQKITYAAGTTLKTATAAGTGPWFSMCGSATKTVRVQQLRFAVTVATSAVYADVVLKKTSTATAAGTPTALTQFPLDAASGAGTLNLVNYYTALATAGSTVGVVDTMQVFAPITGTPAVSVLPVVFDFTVRDEAEAPVLRGTGQCLEANFGTTTTNAPTITVAAKWTEE